MLKTINTALLMLLTVFSFEAMAECQDVKRQVSEEEDRLWALKFRQSTTDKEYQVAYERYSRAKTDYLKCIKSLPLKIES